MEPSDLQAVETLKNLSDKATKKTIKAKTPALISLDGVESLFTDKKEIALANNLYKKYIKDYNLETTSDKNLLRQLIYLEVFHHRLQDMANDFNAEDGAVPTEIIESLHKNLNQILSLKEKLGLTRDKKEEIQTDAFKALELLKKKFTIHRENNQASRTLICPHCGKMVILVIRTEAWEAKKHPFFKDRVLGNEHLIKLYQSGKITKEDVGKVLDCSSSYVDWLITKWSLGINNNINT